MPVPRLDPADHDRLEQPPFEEHDIVRLVQPLEQHGRLWPAGTKGAIVHLGPLGIGCVVEVEESLQGLLDVDYAALEPTGPAA